MYRLLIVLIVLIAGCSRKRPIKSTESVDTSHGRYAWNVTTYAGGKNPALVVREVNRDELESLRSDAKDATSFIAKYAKDSASSDELPYRLDSAFAAWMKSNDPNKESEERVIRIVGASFGFYCIEKLGVHWAITRDALGMDTALVRVEPETQSFPFSSIRYRVEDKKVAFIYGLYLSLEKTIRDAGHIPPNQSLEPTGLTVTSSASAEAAPAKPVAHH